MHYSHNNEAAPSILLVLRPAAPLFSEPCLRKWLYTYLRHLLIVHLLFESHYNYPKVMNAQLAKYWFSLSLFFFLSAFNIRDLLQHSIKESLFSLGLHDCVPLDEFSITHGLFSFLSFTGSTIPILPKEWIQTSKLLQHCITWEFSNIVPNITLPLIDSQIYNRDTDHSFRLLYTCSWNCKYFFLLSSITIT